MNVTKEVVEHDAGERRMMVIPEQNQHRRRDDKKLTTDEQLDHGRMGKGKYSEKSPNWVADHDSKYLIWAYENWTPKPCSKLLYDACVGEHQQERVAKDQDH